MGEILVLDNYDSFTYNLVHYLKELTEDKVFVCRNDKISLQGVDEFDRIILSPGPGIPDDAVILKELISRYAPTKKILGVCLGMQAIAEVFGGELINCNEVYHGVAMNTKVIDDDILFRDIPKEIMVGRYHSWLVSNDSLPSCLKATSVDDAEQIMSLKHKEYDVRGVQFHPESILTEHGKKMIDNWLNIKNDILDERFTK